MTSPFVARNIDDLIQMLESGSPIPERYIKLIGFVLQNSKGLDNALAVDFYRQVHGYSLVTNITDSEDERLSAFKLVSMLTEKPVTTISTQYQKYSGALYENTRIDHDFDSSIIDKTAYED